MSQTTKDLHAEFTKSLALMRTLRDEVRVKLHLAEMDAKSEWDKLEPHLLDLEAKAQHVTDATHVALMDALARLSQIRSKLT